MKIGILGGTFDPIHIAHLMMAEQVRDSLKLDEIWFMPSHVPPHKEGSLVTGAHHRLEMVKLAIGNAPCFRVLPMELERPGPSYTIDTVRALLRQFPHDEFHFIIGGDMIEYLPHWHKIEELAEIIRFVGILRPGSAPESALAEYRVQIVEFPQMDLSSTMIREKVRNGRSIRFMVTDEVRRYIEENGLYESRRTAD